MKSFKASKRSLWGYLQRFFLITWGNARASCLEGGDRREPVRSTEPLGGARKGATEGCAQVHWIRKHEQPYMKIAIMGFGNPVRSDDGVGCHVLERLRETYGEREDVSLFDMGTSAFEVLFQLKGHDVIIIVDAVVNANEPDGTLFKLPAAEINAAIVDDPMVFLHSLKWDQALSYAKKIMQDDFPQHEIYAYLIAVTDTKMGVGLSSPVAQAAERALAYICEDIVFKLK